MRVGRRMLMMEPPDRRGRPKRLKDAVRENIEMGGVTKEDPDDRMRWKRVIHYGDT